MKVSELTKNLYVIINSITRVSHWPKTVTPMTRSYFLLIVHCDVRQSQAEIEPGSFLLHT